MKNRHRNAISLIILFSLILLLTGCNRSHEAHPVARYQEIVTATITRIDKGSWFAGTRHSQTKIWVTDDKYGSTAYFQSYVDGLFYLPKYWNCKKGDKITVIANIEYYVANNQIRRIWLQEVAD
jgi:hypothetical protein